MKLLTFPFTMFGWLFGSANEERGLVLSPGYYSQQVVDAKLAEYDQQRREAGRCKYGIGGLVIVEDWKLTQGE